jgi:hypothetical protein
VIRHLVIVLVLVLGLTWFALAVEYGPGMAATTNEAPKGRIDPALCWNWDAPFGRLAFRPDPKCSRWLGGYPAARADYELNRNPNGPESYYHDEEVFPSA